MLECLAPALGLRLVVASLDDLDLPWPERQQRLTGKPFGVLLGATVQPECTFAAGGPVPVAPERVSGPASFDKTLAKGYRVRCGWRKGICDALVLKGRQPPWPVRI